jgi:exopolyphosphatase / guanosine-5'-triphosphate,3'-diphosphate pyrophosphatase
VRYVRRQTSVLVKAIKKRGFHRVVGTSGTILALGILATRDGGDLRNRRINVKALHRLRRTLTETTLQQRLATPGLDPRRADVLVAGAVLLDTLLRALGATELTFCDFALREGLILDYIKKNGAHIRTVERYPDVRRRSVIELAERCNYIARHATQVARLSLSLFDATQKQHGLGAQEREWLEFAAILHDIGGQISYEGHHKHSQYLIQHGDLRGFEPAEVTIISLVARYHRQSTPKKSHEEFGKLPSSRRRIVKVLSAVLRLAEGLDRSHTQVIGSIEVNEVSDGLLVRLRAGDGPDLELWAAQRHAAPLSELIDRTIRFETAPARGRRRATRPPARSH